MNCEELLQKLQIHFAECRVYWDPAPDPFFTGRISILKIQNPACGKLSETEFGEDAAVDFDETCLAQIIHHAEFNFAQTQKTEPS